MTRFPPDTKYVKQTPETLSPRWTVVPATHCQKPAAVVLELGGRERVRKSPKRRNGPSLNPPNLSVEAHLAICVSLGQIIQIWGFYGQYNPDLLN